MGYELLLSDPEISGSHSWKCLLASNTSDSAMTRLAYCGRRENFQSPNDVARIFWKLWHSRKEYLDLPDGWSTPEIEQKFDIVCTAMQAGFDPFNYDEESGEDEPEDMSAETFAAPKLSGPQQEIMDDIDRNASEAIARGITPGAESGEGYCYFQCGPYKWGTHLLPSLRALVKKGLVDAYPLRSGGRYHFDGPPATYIDRDGCPYALFRRGDERLYQFDVSESMTGKVEILATSDQEAQREVLQAVQRHGLRSVHTDSLGRLSRDISVGDITEQHFAESFEAMTLDENDKLICDQCNTNVEDDPIYAEFTLRCDCGNILYNDDSDGPYDLADFYGAESFDAEDTHEELGWQTHVLNPGSSMPPEVIRTVRLPAEHGGRIVNVLAYKERGDWIYYLLDNDSPNLSVDTGTEILWANLKGTWEELEAEQKLKRESCCCGATKSNPCACMIQGVMQCDATCPCSLAKKGAESFGAELNKKQLEALKRIREKRNKSSDKEDETKCPCGGDIVEALVCNHCLEVHRLYGAESFEANWGGISVVGGLDEMDEMLGRKKKQSETFAACEGCDGEYGTPVYECDCCYEEFCQDCFEMTVDYGHSPYRGSIDDEWCLIVQNPRIEETDTGSSWSGGAICGMCAAEIENELENLPEVSMNLSAETKLKGKVKTISGKPHTPRELVRDKDITPEEAAKRKSLQSQSAEWYKRVSPLNPNQFYYSRGNRPEYTPEDIKHGAYGNRLGRDGTYNEQLNARGKGFDNITGQTIALPNELYNEFNMKSTESSIIPAVLITALLGIGLFTAFKN